MRASPSQGGARIPVLGRDEGGVGGALRRGLFRIPKGGQKRLPAFATLTVAATAAIPAGEAATAALTPLLRPGFVDGEAASIEFLLIQRFARRASLSVVVHLDEAETLGPPGFALGDDGRRDDRSVGGKRPLSIAVCYVIAQVADVQFLAHRHAPGWGDGNERTVL